VFSRTLAHLNAGAISLWIKIPYLVFLSVLIPSYWAEYGPANFLWFSDIALFGTGAAIWLENSLLGSMMALMVLLPDLAWNVDFLFRLISGKDLLNLTGYMFDARKPLVVRGLSLFHVVLPWLLVWLVDRLGYDSRAFPVQTVVAWVTLVLVYLFTDPAENINWVFGPGTKPQKRISPRLYLLAVMIFFPLLVYLPTHLLLVWLGRKRNG
jgi:hypothetical protein